MFQEQIGRLRLKVKRVYNGFFPVYEVQTDRGAREVMDSRDSVNVLIYDPRWNKVLLTRQSRIAVCSEKNPQGMMLEAVAGYLDPGETPQQAMAREAEEEVRVKIDPNEIVLMSESPLALSPGKISEKTYLGFYGKEGILNRVDTRKIGGVEGENERIEKVVMSPEQAWEEPDKDISLALLLHFFLC